MELNYSAHSIKRSSQRSIPKNIMEFIYQYGQQVPRPGGATAYVVNSRVASSMIQDLKSMINRIEKAQKKVIIVDDSTSQVITTYHRRQRNTG